MPSGNDPVTAIGSIRSLLTADRTTARDLPFIIGQESTHD